MRCRAHTSIGWLLAVLASSSCGSASSPVSVSPAADAQSRATSRGGARLAADPRVQHAASGDQGRPLGGEQGAKSAPPAPDKDAPGPIEQGRRIAATGPHVWIMPEPSSEGLALGNVRMGTSVTLAETEPKPGPGCARGWYAVKPNGYVCLGPRTTLDLADPYYRALHDVAPPRGALYPYHYAYSRGAPMYSRVPSPEEWKQTELKHGPVGEWAELGPWASGHEELLDDRAIGATDPVPWFFEGGQRRVAGDLRSSAQLVWKTIPNGSMLAYARAFEMHGRVWLVTPDLTLVPADRVQPIRHSEFQGVELGGDVTLPIAWNRGFESTPLYRRDSGGAFVATEESLGGKAWQLVDGKKHGGAEAPYFSLRDRPDRYLRGKDITIAWPRKELPKAIKAGEKWIDAHITPGTMIAYVGLVPVYATLFSPGKGGHPVPGNDHSKFATTQTGYFRFEWKEAVATMSNETGDPKVLWFSDVPHIQYVRAPLAMHVAYWHEDFSNPKSAECLNLSARDGRWMFGWTDPPLPEDWGAVRPQGGFGSSTAIMINGF